MTVNSKIWHLMNMDIFRDLQPQHYDIIDRESKSLYLKKRQVLPFAQTGHKNIFFLKHGTLKVSKNLIDGKTVTIDLLKDGSLFGEIIDEIYDERDTYVEAIDDSLLCVMKKANFDRLMQEVPILSRRIVKIVGLRVKRIESRLADMVYSNVHCRLARVLVNLTKDFGQSDKEGIVLKIRLTHNDIAELTASTRETVTMILNELKQAGIINYYNRKIVIQHLEALSSIAKQKGYAQNQMTE